MDNYERTIDLVHVLKCIKYNFKKILKVTLTVTVLMTMLVLAKSVILPSKEYYYSTAKILYKFDSWSTTEKDFSFEDWKFNGTEEYRSDSNLDFLGNAKYVFKSDKILSYIMNEFSIDKEFDEFKKDVIVDNLSGSQMVRIVVKAESPELAKNILNSIIEAGNESVENLYDLKCEIIDEYTDYENTFNKLEVDSKGTIEITTNTMKYVKLILVSTAGSLALMVAYYSLKCLLNNKVESVDMIENGFGVPVLQVVGKGNKNYDITAVKLINSGSKSILFTSINKDESISNDVLSIAKTLVERNKKVLVISLGIMDGVNLLLGFNNCKDIITTDGVDFITSEISDYKQTIEKYVKDYDCVLIESNCLDNNSDALLISKVVDYTVLITKCDSITVDEYNQKIIDFKRYSSGVDGVLLKDVTEESSSFKFVRNN